MYRRLLSTVGVYGVVAPALVVSAVYAGLQFGGPPFSLVGFSIALVGLMVGPLMFARAGTAPSSAGGGDVGGGGEHEADTFVEAGSSTPLQARVGLFLLGAAAISALFLAVG